MKPFDYFSPKTLAEAIDLLAHYHGTARVIAGGTDLLLQMKVGKLAPKAVINIKRIPELHTLELNGHLRLGALTTLETVRRSPMICEHYAALADTASTMASVQIRNLATVGGNLCTAAPSADFAPILIALNATAHIAGPHGERCVPLEEFFVGPSVSCLAPDELLVTIDVPRPTGPTLYLKHAPRAWMDIAVVGVALALQLTDEVCTDAQIVLGAVAPTPLRARRAEAELRGRPLTADRAARASAIAANEAKPIDDVRSSAWYRRQMVEVLTRRGLISLAGLGAE